MKTTKEEELLFQEPVELSLQDHELILGKS